MHELSVTQSILDIVLQHAKERKVQQVNLVIGQFSSIVDDSVQFYWDIIAKDTLAAEAKLHFERIPGEMTCNSCGHVFHPGSETFLCPACESNAVRVSGGREFQVDSIDVE
ncbi:MAG: hydrogenase maturation nickel metallochaperone HypA [Candidatus Electrothrix aestuarii]|jgi:hydrogenase nickel incorporation protein HypA/HybF|uniref:Hydrogenase maturation factor HypA n=1 Tax=Candidatus Electrothrix aestuarii TaxID=3062594 RepID=A0AAU8LXT3_9BACT|nr:hydrogenase maturation nickel metallochaperone HypA [Candidatus Electrothrix aestuarii]